MHVDWFTALILLSFMNIISTRQMVFKFILTLSKGTQGVHFYLNCNIYYVRFIFNVVIIIVPSLNIVTLQKPIISIFILIFYVLKIVIYLKCAEPH